MLGGDDLTANPSDAQPVEHDGTDEADWGRWITGPGPDLGNVLAGFETDETTDNQYIGFELDHDFSGDTEAYEMQCQFVVPNDYDDGGSVKPQVVILGMADDDGGTAVPCGIVGCTVNDVKLEVQSRAYGDGQTVASAWGTAFSVTEQLQGEVCGAAYCIDPNVIESTTITAANAVNSWSAGEICFLRIRRLDVTDNAAIPYRVLGVQLNYPN